MEKKSMDDFTRNALEFYADKPADRLTCPATAAYLDCLRELDLQKDGSNLGGPYQTLVREFKGLGSPDGKDRKFFEELKKREQAGERYESLRPLKDKDKDFDLFLRETDYYDVRLQKWHLFVSWAAYKEYLEWEKRFNFSCKELLMWLYESAETDKDEKTKFENSVCTVCDMVKEVIRGLDSESKAARDKITAGFKEIIHGILIDLEIKAKIRKNIKNTRIY